jgi:hypothetical protein
VVGMGGAVMTCSLQDDLVFSRGEIQNTDAETIKAMIHGCVSVSQAHEATDRNGIDYIATLRRGARVFIDAKTRRSGCSKFWMADQSGKPIPEVALEKWSVMPGGRYRKRDGKVGWTLCEQKQTDFILYTFDRADSREVFLFAFQLLRIAFRRNIDLWFERFKNDIQDSGTWQSQAVFVPVDLVMDAVRSCSHATVVRTSSGIALQYELGFTQ